MTLDETDPAAQAPGRSLSPKPGADRTLYLIDIAASGGAPVRLALERAFDAEERTFVYEQGDIGGAMSIEGFAALDPSVRERLALVMGHFAYGIHRRSRRAHTYVTLLRDPVQRVLALHREFLDRAALRHRARGSMWRPAPNAAPISLEEFVFGQQHLDVDNGMVRALAGRHHVRFGQCPDDLLDEAMSHVEQDFQALLVAEEMAMSMRILAGMVGRPLPEPARPAASVDAASLEDIDRRVLDRIRSLNQLDLSLHETARSRLPGSYAGLVG